MSELRSAASDGRSKKIRTKKSAKSRNKDGASVSATGSQDGKQNLGALNKSIAEAERRSGLGGNQDQPPEEVLGKSMSHAEIKSAHKAEIQKSKTTLKDKYDSLERSRQSLANLGQEGGRNAGAQQTKNTTSQRESQHIYAEQPEGAVEGGTFGQPKHSLATGVTKSVRAQSPIVREDANESEMAKQEADDNRALASQKHELESLQKQAPPTDTKELVQYLMQRLEAAEKSIAVHEGVIQSERELRKSSSKFLKAQNKSLAALVEKEKRNLSDKVSAELDNTLKRAVEEKVQIKVELEKVAAEKNTIQREYLELQDLYNTLKQVKEESEKLNTENEKTIKNLESEAIKFKTAKDQLQTQNENQLELTNKAVKDYKEISDAISKLDEARFVMNKLMGPDGALNPGQRQAFLAKNLEQHDKLIASMGKQSIVPIQGSLRPSSGLHQLNNVPNKGYFKQGGISGGIGQPNAAPLAAIQNQNADDAGEEDEFWYAGGGGGAAAPTQNVGAGIQNQGKAAGGNYYNY